MSQSFLSEIHREKKIIRQLRGVLPMAEPQERSEIRSIIRRRQIRLALLSLQIELEKQVTGCFSPEISRKLDAVEILLN